MPRPTMTVLMCELPDGVLARGIVEDLTVFDHAHFSSTREAREYVKRAFSERFNVVIGGTKR